MMAKLPCLRFLLPNTVQFFLGQLLWGFVSVSYYSALQSELSPFLVAYSSLQTVAYTLLACEVAAPRPATSALGLALSLLLAAASLGWVGLYLYIDLDKLDLLPAELPSPSWLRPVAVAAAGLTLSRHLLSAWLARGLRARAQPAVFWTPPHTWV
jgi:hypothetical protein